MGGRSRKALLAAGLSLFVPGAGQLYLGERRRALVLLGLFVLCCGGALALVGVGRSSRCRRSAGRSSSCCCSRTPRCSPCVCSRSSTPVARPRLHVWPPSRSPRSPLLPPCRTWPPRTSRCAGTACSKTCSRARSRPTSSATGGCSSRSASGPRAGRSRPAGRAPARALPGPAPTPFRGDGRPLTRLLAARRERGGRARPAVGDDPAARQRRGTAPGGRPDRHDDRRRDPAGDRARRPLRRAAEPRRRPGATRGGVPRAAERALPVRQPPPVLFPGGREPGATALKQAHLAPARPPHRVLRDGRPDGFVQMVDALGGVRSR